jgi:hypothetical protein
MEPWMERLKRAYDACYYKTESAREAQSAFPCQNRTCKDCPFWRNHVCLVFAESRVAMAYTCVYFDPLNHESAWRAVEQHRSRRWPWPQAA